MQHTLQFKIKHWIAIPCFDHLAKIIPILKVSKQK